MLRPRLEKISVNPKMASTMAMIPKSLFSNNRARINSFSISTGEASMSFSNLSLTNGETLVIDHDDNGKRNNLRIRIKGTAGSYRSAMAKRNTGSSNELTISPGTHTVSMTAGGAGTIIVSCNGRFA